MDRPRASEAEPWTSAAGADDVKPLHALLEWNVRLSSVATPDALRKFEAAFDGH